MGDLREGCIRSGRSRRIITAGAVRGRGLEHLLHIIAIKVTELVLVRWRERVFFLNEAGKWSAGCGDSIISLALRMRNMMRVVERILIFVE